MALVGHKPDDRMDAFLYDLGVGYGWCLSAEQAATVRSEPRDDPDSFADAVIRAYGLDPVLCDRRDRASVTHLVVEWFFAPDGKGARSGLP